MASTKYHGKIKYLQTSREQYATVQCLWRLMETKYDFTLKKKKRAGDEDEVSLFSEAWNSLVLAGGKL